MHNTLRKFTRVEFQVGFRFYQNLFRVIGFPHEDPAIVEPHKFNFLIKNKVLKCVEFL